MRWSDVRVTYPEQWLVIEALESHTKDNLYVVDDVSVLECCPDGAAALEVYRRLHKLHPERELLFVHTSRQVLSIEERRWVGVRSSA